MQTERYSPPLVSVKQTLSHVFRPCPTSAHQLHPNRRFVRPLILLLVEPGPLVHLGRQSRDRRVRQEEVDHEVEARRGLVVLGEDLSVDDELGCFDGSGRSAPGGGECSVGQGEGGRTTGDLSRELDLLDDGVLVRDDRALESSIRSSTAWSRVLVSCVVPSSSSIHPAASEKRRTAPRRRQIALLGA